MLKKIVTVAILLNSLIMSSIIDINDKLIDKQGLMLGAIKTGNIELIKLLTKAGININEVRNGYTPLIYCLDCLTSDLSSNDEKNIEIIRTLLNAGASVNIKRQDGFLASPLDHLIYKNDKSYYEAFELLYNAGSFINIDNCGLIYECLGQIRDKNVFESILKLIINRLLSNSSMQEINSFLQNMLMIDGTADNYLKVLIENMLKIEDKINTVNLIWHCALIQVCKRESLRERKEVVIVAKLLLDAGAEINIKDNNNKTAVQYACESGNLNLIKLFLDHNKTNTKKQSL